MQNDEKKEMMKHNQNSASSKENFCSILPQNTFGVCLTKEGALLIKKEEEIIKENSLNIQENQQGYRRGVLLLLEVDILKRALVILFSPFLKIITVYKMKIWPSFQRMESKKMK